MCRRQAVATLALLLLAALFAPVCRALPITLDPPRDGEYVRDLAGLLSAGDRTRVNAAGAALLRDTKTPILVVTIDSMARHDGDGLRIETFATLLFDQWGIGHARADDGELWNTGVLLLVSKGDRRARIELGAGWRREFDRRAERIMEGEIVPRFRSGDFSAGIRAGVEALDRMVRDAAPAVRGGSPTAAAGSASTVPRRGPVRLEDMPVERPLPSRDGHAAAAATPPRVLDSASVPVESTTPSAPAQPTAPRPTRDDHLVYPTTGSSGSSAAFAWLPLIFLAIVVLIVFSVIRRGLRGIGYLTGHRGASGLGMLIGALNASQRHRSGYARQPWGSPPAGTTTTPPPPPKFGVFPAARPSTGGFFSSSIGTSSRRGGSGASGGGRGVWSPPSAGSRGGGFSGGGGATGSW